MTILYKYLGGGSLYHVPARDITEVDVEERAELWLENGISEELLISSGLYEKVGNEPQETKRKSKRGAIYAAEEGE